MKRIPATVLSICLLSLLALAPLGASVESEAVETVPVVTVEAVTVTSAIDSFELATTSLPVLEERARIVLCIEPSPCQTHADCGPAGVCLWNFDYPEIRSPKVCHCR